MKKVDIYVPKDYDVPHSMYTDNAHNVITVGDIMFSKCDDVILENNPSHFRRIEEERSEAFGRLGGDAQKMELTEENHQNQLRHFMDMNASLQRQMQAVVRRKGEAGERPATRKGRTCHVFEGQTDRDQPRDNSENRQPVGQRKLPGQHRETSVRITSMLDIIINEFPEAIVDDVSGGQRTAIGYGRWIRTHFGA